MDHEYFMRIAIEQAKQNPYRPYASLIVNADREILVQSNNNVKKSPTFHSEIVSINECAEKHSPEDWQSFILYSTAEPCTMCQSAIYWAGIGKVVYGTSIPLLKELFGLEIDIRAAEVSNRAPIPCDIMGGVLQEECDSLFLTAKKLRKNE